MNKSGKLMWISSKSWVLDEKLILRRPSEINLLCGIGRDGEKKNCYIVTEKNNSSQRLMYEFFTTKGYAIIDAECKLITQEGPVTPGEIYDKMLQGEKIVLEEYIGEQFTCNFHEDQIMCPPHLEFFPIRIKNALLEKLLSCDLKLPYSLPRPLFSEINWITCYIKENLEEDICIKVDNKLFPSEVYLQEREISGCHLIGATKYYEERPLLALTEKENWHPVCDGLIVML